ncbi:MAG: hypothetical protein ABL879_13295, partial [Devosia sp.]
AAADAAAVAAANRVIPAAAEAAKADSELVGLGGTSVNPGTGGGSSIGDAAIAAALKKAGLSGSNTGAISQILSGNGITGRLVTTAIIISVLADNGISGSGANRFAEALAGGDGASSASGNSGNGSSGIGRDKSNGDPNRIRNGRTVQQQQETKKAVVKAISSGLAGWSKKK